MPDNTILLVGIGLAAFTLFRQDKGEVEETDLVDRSMMASGTGDISRGLSLIDVIQAGQPINEATVEEPIIFEWPEWFKNMAIPGSGPAEIVVNIQQPEKRDDPDRENSPQGQQEVIREAAAKVITPFVQTPVYIIDSGEKAGQAIRQLGIQTEASSVDLVNPKIYIEEIVMGEEYTFPTLTASEEVEIVSGGANIGLPYFTNLNVLSEYRDLGGFNAPNWEKGIGSNVFDPKAAMEALAIMTTPRESKPVVLVEDPGTGYDTGLDWI
jgi:hypothetical protein